jgi:DNA adenine methylase
MKPLLKWAGGKRHIAHTLERHLPEDWSNGTYFEPFLGGAALFLHLKPGSAVLADLNPWLVRFYQDVRDAPQGLLDGIQTLADSFDSVPTESKKDFYLDARAKFNDSQPSIHSSALFFALNKLCFNGLYRENSKGKFNVPFGQKLKFPSVISEDFLSASGLLAETSLTVADFVETVEMASEGDFVYFDPPYIPVSATSSFTSYSSEGFGLDAQRRLASTMLNLKERGVRALTSNSFTDLTAEIYGAMRQEVVLAPRMVSARSSGRGEVKELLITNY